MPGILERPLASEPPEPPATFAYDIGLDIDTFNALLKKRTELPKAEYDRELERSRILVMHNIMTYLGECHNVVESAITYTIRDGRVYHPELAKPALESYKDGQAYRRKHGNPLDFEREDAEIEGFGFIEASAVDPNTPHTKMIINLSRPSGLYRKNFADIFVVFDDNSGRRLEMVRLASHVSTQEALDLANEVEPGVEREQSAVGLLRRPAMVSADITLGELRRRIQKTDDFITADQLDVIVRNSLELMRYYCQLLEQQPQDYQALWKTLKAIRARSQETVAGFSVNDLPRYQYQTPVLVEELHVPIHEQVQRLWSQDDDSIDGGCGTGLGNSRSMLGADGALAALFGGNAIAMLGLGVFSVEDYANMPESLKRLLKILAKQEWFECPKCNYKADGPVGDSCPGCGLTKQEFAKQGGEVC